MRLIQIYTPHGGQTNEKYRRSSNELIAVVNEERSTLIAITSDLNATVAALISREQSEANFRFGKRNSHR